MFEDFGVRFFKVFGKEFFPFRMEIKDVEWLPQIEVAQNNGHFYMKLAGGLAHRDLNVREAISICAQSQSRRT